MEPGPWKRKLEELEKDKDTEIAALKSDKEEVEKKNS